MDCSVTKRKGCNYCLRSKKIETINSEYYVRVDDERCIINIEADDDFIGGFKVNYCPICGKEL